LDAERFRTIALVGGGRELTLEYNSGRSEMDGTSTIENDLDSCDGVLARIDGRPVEVDGWGLEGFEETKFEGGVGAGLAREFRGAVNALAAARGDVYSGLEEEGEL
jgi:hypothetical protein